MTESHRNSASSRLGSVNHYLWELIILLKKLKNANELGPAWQNIAGKGIGKGDIHGQKENGLEFFRSSLRRHFKEIKQPKTLNKPQWRALHFKRLKINMHVTTSQYDISSKNSHLLSQNVFLQSIIYPSDKKIHLNKQHFGMR